MQNYLYEKSLSIYYKGKYSHIPYLDKNTNEVIILGVSYSIVTSNREIKTKNLNENDEDKNEKFSKSCLPEFNKSKNTFFTLFMLYLLNIINHLIN